MELTNIMNMNLSPTLSIAFYISYTVFLVGIGLGVLYYIKVLKHYNIKAIIFDKKANGMTKIILDKFRKVKSEDMESEGYVYRGWKIKTEVPALEDTRNMYLFEDRGKTRDMVFYFKLNDKDYRPIELFEDQQKNLKIYINNMKKEEKAESNEEIIKKIIDEEDSPIYNPVMKPIPIDMIFWNVQVGKNILRRYVQKDKIMQMIIMATPIMYGILLFISYYILTGKFDDLISVTADLPNVCKDFAQNIGQ